MVAVQATIILILKKRGLDNYIAYHGIDIADKNVYNCKLFFPEAEFSVGNIYELNFPESSFDIVLVSHVFEHLSPENLSQAFKEVIRVARSQAIINFFNEKDIMDHIVERRSLYYWNTLSRRKIKNIIKNKIRDLDITDIYPGFAKKFEIAGAYGPESYSSWVLSLDQKQSSHI